MGIRRRHQKFQEIARRRPLGGRGADAGGLDDVVLHLRRKRADQRDTLDSEQFADRRDAKLGLAPGYGFARQRAVRDGHHLGLERFGEAKALDQAGEVDAALPLPRESAAIWPCRIKASICGGARMVRSNASPPSIALPSTAASP